MRLSRIPGVAVSVVHRDSVVYEGGFGVAGPEAGRVTTGSPFYIGSVTKTFTALAVAQLADAGKLGFDDPVQKHLPDFRLADAQASRTLTLRHLLTHTSGLSQWSGHDRRAQEEGRFEHIGPARVPGRRFEYSSLNFIILGCVVEAVSGLTYGEYLRRHIFEPLEMSSSFVDPVLAARDGLAHGSWYLFGLPVWGREPPQPGPLVPAGFAISSARDLSHYLSAHLSGGLYRGRAVVSEQALREMLTPSGGAETGPGMAWGVGRRTISHSGNARTFSARVALLPESGHGVAILANVNSGPFFDGTTDLLQGVVRILRGEEVDTHWPKEVILKLAILAAVVLGLIRFARRAWKWASLGFPVRLSRRPRILSALALDLLAAAVLLVLLPRWIGVPLGVMLEYFPDLGIAMIAGIATGLLGGFIKAFLASTS